MEMPYVYVVHIDYYWNHTYEVKVFLHEKDAKQYAEEIERGKRMIKITEEKVYISADKEDSHYPRHIYCDH